MTVPVQPESPPTVCAICNGVLDIFEPRGGGEPQWHHTLEWTRRYGEPDHEAMPVPGEVVQRVDAVCDFCSSTEVAFTFGWQEEFTYRAFEPRLGEVAGGGMSNNWAACEGCARHIRTRNILGLEARARRQFKQRDQGALWDMGGPAAVEMWQWLFAREFVEAPVTAKDPFGNSGIAQAWEERRKAHHG